MTAIAAAGTTFACRASGDGPLTVLLHGFGMDSRMWDPLVACLRTRRRYIAVDMRGAGGTPPGPGPLGSRGAGAHGGAGADVPLERHADDVAALLAASGVDRADVVGFSMGAFVLLALLERHPALVRSAVFVGARANADDAPTRAGRDALVRTLLTEGRDAGFLQVLPKLVAPGASDDVCAELRTMFEEQPTEGLVSALRAMRARPDRLGVLAGVSVPVLVVAGEHDAFAPPPLPQQMAAAAPQGRLEVIAGAGHTMPLEATDTLASLLDTFWQRTDGTAAAAP